MGSVKKLKILSPAVDLKEGVGRLFFTDKFSIFDYGSMPDTIPDKGRALALIGAFFYELFEEHGIKTRYRGVIENGVRKKLDDISQPPEELELSLCHIFRPDFKDGQYVYPDYSLKQGNFFIPLEFIYRNRLPKWASIFKRLESGEITYESLGLKSYPSPGEKLPTPFIDVSTKLEAIDRYLTWEEARKIASLSEKDEENIKQFILKINSIISDRAAQAGFENLDGKLELGFGADRRLFLSDLAGTPDESRLVMQGFPANKDVLRQFYRTTPWYSEIEKLKKEKGGLWLEFAPCPPPLDDRLKELVSNLYKSIANALTGKEWFSAPPTIEILKEIDLSFPPGEKKP